MATYKEIKGVTVQTRDSDPVVNVGAWSSGGDFKYKARSSIRRFQEQQHNTAAIALQVEYTLTGTNSRTEES